MQERNSETEKERGRVCVYDGVSLTLSYAERQKARIWHRQQRLCRRKNATDLHRDLAERPVSWDGDDAKQARPVAYIRGAVV